MDAVALLRMQPQSAHTWCESTLGATDEEAVHRVPPGKANPAAVAYAHTVCSEDMTINGWLRGAAPLAAGEWSGKTGVSEPMPNGPAYFEWTRKVRVDIPQVREYSKAVYASSDAYLASLSESDLERSIDVPGVGAQTLAWILNQWVIGHSHDETGEISAIKGVHGMTGYDEG